MSFVAMKLNTWFGNGVLLDKMLILQVVRIQYVTEVVSV